MVPIVSQQRGAAQECPRSCSLTIYGLLSGEDASQLVDLQRWRSTLPGLPELQLGGAPRLGAGCGTPGGSILGFWILQSFCSAPCYTQPAKDGIGFSPIPSLPLPLSPAFFHLVVPIRIVTLSETERRMKLS